MLGVVSALAVLFNEAGPPSSAPSGALRTMLQGALTAWLRMVVANSLGFSVDDSYGAHYYTVSLQRRPEPVDPR